MEREESVSFNEKGKVLLLMKDLLTEGTFCVNERGFGFVTIDPEESDVYIPKEATNFVVDGDMVLIGVIQYVNPFSGRGAKGKVKEIKERVVNQVVGRFMAYSEEEMVEMGLYGYMTSKDRKLNQHTVSIAPEGIKPVDGSIVTAEITYYPDQEYPTSMEGLVEQVIGHRNDSETDILSIVVAHGIPTAFPDEVLAEAD